MYQHARQQPNQINTSKGLAIVLAIILIAGFVVLYGAAYWGW